MNAIYSYKKKEKEEYLGFSIKLKQHSINHFQNFVKQTEKGIFFHIEGFSLSKFRLPGVEGSSAFCLKGTV